MTEQPIDLSDLMTPLNAAAYKGVSISAVYKAMKGGKLATIEVLGKRALRRTDVDAWTPAGHGGARRGKAAEAAQS